MRPIYIFYIDDAKFRLNSARPLQPLSFSPSSSPFPPSLKKERTRKCRSRGSLPPAERNREREISTSIIRKTLRGYGERTIRATAGIPLNERRTRKETLVGSRIPLVRSGWRRSKKLNRAGIDL